MSPLLKICGLMREGDLDLCLESGVDMLGFVVEYPTQTPWSISRHRADALISRPGVRKKSCLVTGGEADKILSLVDALRPAFVQLHAPKSIENTAFFIHELIAFGTLPIFSLPSDEPEKAAITLSELGAHMLLLDPRQAENPLKSGSADLSLYRKISQLSDAPLLLAGGLSSANLSHVLGGATLFGVDILSAAEIEPGVKNHAEILKILEILHL